jgi:LuxR family transcriptional regulator, activator of conjugal transfer of Ti plasmids
MSIGERLMSFLVSAPETKTQASLGGRLLAFSESLGVSRYACLYLRRDGAGLKIHRAISNVPEDWQQTYLERGYHVSDPVFQGAMQSSACGYWTELASGVSATPRASEVMRFAGEIQMLDGFTSLVRTDSEATAIVMVSGRKLQTTPEARVALKSALHVFANEGQRMTAVPGLSGKQDAGVRLTPAQMRVLLLKAEGHTNASVARRLRRDTKTIETHISEILRRLDARNMNDAIRIAFRLQIL